MRFIAFDVETTGTLAGVDKIVELGAVRFTNGVPDAVFSTLIDPLMPIPPIASSINGISNDMVQGKPTIEKILEPFAEFCGQDVLVAHNANFDYQFLLAEIKRHQSRAPKGFVLCTLNMSRKVFPGMPNYKLGTLVSHLKISADTFHRAEQDANSCGGVFLKILDKVALPNQAAPLENLLALSGGQNLKFPQIVAQPKQLDMLDLL